MDSAMTSLIDILRSHFILKDSGAPVDPRRDEGRSSQRNQGWPLMENFHRKRTNSRAGHEELERRRRRNLGMQNALTKLEEKRSIEPSAVQRMSKE